MISSGTFVKEPQDHRPQMNTGLSVEVTNSIYFSTGKKKTSIYNTSSKQQ
jgi:hypothetical protein